MRYPAYRAEDGDAASVAEAFGPRGPDPPPEAGDGRRGRRMRTSFGWRELYSIDPVNALKVRAEGPPPDF